MNSKKGETIILEDNAEYIVVDSFEMNNKKYLFLIGKEKKDLNLVEVENDFLKKIESDSEFEQVFNKLYERNKDVLETN